MQVEKRMFSWLIGALQMYGLGQPCESRLVLSSAMAQ